jgi:F-type H+-transporting ATPase subunit gamma
MEQLAKLQGRIETLEELRELMRAMRALAASHVQGAQSALEGIRENAAVIEDAIAAGVTLLPGQGAPAAGAAGEPDLLLVLTSEHGFVGGFNDALVDRAADLTADGSPLAMVGQRGTALAQERNLSLAWSEPMATQVAAVLGVARRIAGRMAGFQRARIVYGGYRRGGYYEVEERRILPLDPALLQRSNGRAKPLHHLPAEVLLLRLADEYLVAELTRAIMESFASENAARLRVMESANRNIDNRLGKLSGEALRLRQTAITAELLDLITGAEAILGDAR